jgi:hypothetical protein
VELVYEPPASAGGGGGPEARPENSDDPFCAFWRGDDPRIHAELCELLNEEGIPHKTVRREDHLFNLNSKSGFQIGIPFSQFEKAEAAIKDAYGTEEEQQDAAHLLPFSGSYTEDLGGPFPWQPLAKGYARALLGRGEEPGREATPVLEGHDADEQTEHNRPDWDPTNWNPEGATLAVWSSEQSYPGEIIEMALRENQIHSRFEKAGRRYDIFVLPEDERRAREIVREVVEGAAPE